MIQEALHETLEDLPRCRLRGDHEGAEEPAETGQLTLDQTAGKRVEDAEAPEEDFVVDGTGEVFCHDGVGVGIRGLDGAQHRLVPVVVVGDGEDESDEHHGGDADAFRDLDAELAVNESVDSRLAGRLQGHEQDRHASPFVDTLLLVETHRSQASDQVQQGVWKETQDMHMGEAIR